VIEPIPTVDFVIAPDSGCSPLGVNFQFNNYVSPTTDYLYVEFGDGATDTVFPQVINPTLILWPQITHVFTNTGTIDSTYTITVTGYNNCGDSSATADVVVEPNIVQAFFTTSSVIECEGNSISFNNQSSGYTNSDWCFDYDTSNASCGGLASNQISPNFVFPNPGLYNVALFVDNGCSYDTMVQTIEIQERPIANFSFTDSTCSNISTVFTNSSSTNVGFISSYQWDFGDSTSSSLINPGHLYDSSGVFTACLQVEATNGCRDTLCQAVTILALPDIDFSVNNACLNDQPVQFVNNSTISGSSITGTSWSFGDGNGTNVFSPDHSYNSDSTYQVTLIHTAATGCSDTATNTVIIYPVPTADFEISLASADSCSVPQTYAFTNNSTGAVAYTWDFDTLLAGSATSTLTNPNHTYTQAGVYGISLTVENQFGCFDTHADSQIVSSGVTAAFNMGPLEGCAPLVVNFTDISIDNDTIDPIQSWTWNHGMAGTITSLGDTSYIFEYLGNYTSQLVIQSLRGCTDTITQGGIIVHPTPEADFEFELIHSTAIQFDNTSITYQPDIQYFWDFEGGGSSFEESPQHQYPTNVMSFDSIVNCLEVVNDLGCADTICRSAYLPPYILVVPNAFAPEMTNVGEDNIFLPKGNALIDYRLRIFDKWGNKIFETTSLGPNGVPNEPWDGTYNGKLLEMGTYVWRIEAKFDDGADWNGNLDSTGNVRKYGTVTLIR
jgi:PKD repeat protein